MLSFSINSTLFWLQKLGMKVKSWEPINTKVLWTKKGTFDTEKTQENSREEDWATIRAEDSWRLLIFRVFFNLYLFISSLYLIICLSWTLEIAILCTWLWEANSLFLREIGRTRCWFFSIIVNKSLQYSVLMLVILAGLFYSLLQLRNWIE